MVILEQTKTIKNLLAFIGILFIIFLINISIEYSKYQEVVYEELYETQVEIVNIYEKEKVDVLRLKNSNFQFFTSVNKDNDLNKLDLIEIAFLTKRIDFISYLKGFYAKNIYFDKLQRDNTFKDKISQKINENHQNPEIKEVFNALFLAIPVSSELRDTFANYGITHLIALSGFHLSVLSFLIYWIIYFPYDFFHKRHFPYRNKKFDLLLITLVLLFLYLLLTDIVASLLRAFIMLTLGIFLLRSNIKLISFTNLLLTFLIIIAFLPKYIFSISLWFSLSGVFYIFLYIKYFNELKSMVIKLLLFNFWIYFAMNPIVHYFFTNTTYEQLYSPFITIAFTFFYPLELFAHIFGFAEVFDSYLEIFLAKEFIVFDVSTSLFVFLLYIFLSFASIVSKSSFILLNVLLIAFSVYLYT
ncbi:ComEC/Rec2 family competence protein [Poseidonibacter lekithochrous]|uniref:ComEC/Rec2 family competence protein n=1 Tax=Poseidonibacter TaxID=2321187 RepID=UPI001C084181|nr:MULTISPECIES: ComEC/Rec2 family competence protein [Poseidonibacter]MBU3013541.1 ComEC/Rec2 family competence protein [Poseidonibacter lekithochrous]MDO6826838.1 ComEC/Rec2 family competence protein [Poseidonibacter sp. 1_MG-2023]